MKIEHWNQRLPFLELIVGISVYDIATKKSGRIQHIDEKFLFLEQETSVYSVDSSHCSKCWGESEWPYHAKNLRYDLDTTDGFLSATKRLWRSCEDYSHEHGLLVERCLWQLVYKDIPMELKVELAEALHTLNPYGDTP